MGIGFIRFSAYSSFPFVLIFPFLEILSTEASRKFFFLSDYRKDIYSEEFLEENLFQVILTIKK